MEEKPPFAMRLDTRGGRTVGAALRWRYQTRRCVEAESLTATAGLLPGRPGGRAPAVRGRAGGGLPTAFGRGRYSPVDRDPERPSGMPSTRTAFELGSPAGRHGRAVGPRHATLLSHRRSDAVVRPDRGRHRPCSAIASQPRSAPAPPFRPRALRLWPHFAPAPAPRSASPESAAYPPGRSDRARRSPSVHRFRCSAAPHTSRKRRPRPSSVSAPLIVSRQVAANVPPGVAALGREHVLREHVRVSGRHPGQPSRCVRPRRVHQRATPIRRHRTAPSEPAGEPAASPPASSAAPPRPRPETRRPIWTRWPGGSTSRCRRDCGRSCGSTAREQG